MSRAVLRPVSLAPPPSLIAPHLTRSITLFLSLSLSLSSFLSLSVLPPPPPHDAFLRQSRVISYHVMMRSIHSFNLNLKCFRFSHHSSYIDPCVESTRPRSQCFGGLDQADAEDVWGTLYFLLAIAMITAFIVLQTLVCCRTKRDSPVDLSGPRQPEHGGAAVQTGTRS